jgi:hypothetical protein
MREREKREREREREREDLVKLVGGGEGAISTAKNIWREDLQRPCQLYRSLHASSLSQNKTERRYQCSFK